MSDAHRAMHEHKHGHQHYHDHSHSHGIAHSHDAADGRGREISVERSLLELNDHLAEHNRETFEESGTFVVNMMSSPGAGKTRLLERTLADLADEMRMAVIVGDLQTENDAERLRGRGAAVVPLTTGTMCHLEAHMVQRACAVLDLPNVDLLLIENVGNLVCPASFDLGEASRVVLMSVTEGEDKPLKYPPMFKAADVVLVTKVDIAAAAGFQRDTALENIRRIAPQAQIIEVSAATGSGLEEWYGYLLDKTGQQQQLVAMTAKDEVH
jgi:hydrogenase nickel incorporation protein HypB